MLSLLGEHARRGTGYSQVTRDAAQGRMISEEINKTVKTNLIVIYVCIKGVCISKWYIRTRFYLFNYLSIYSSFFFFFLFSVCTRHGESDNSSFLFTLSQTSSPALRRAQRHEGAVDRQAGLHQRH